MSAVTGQIAYGLTSPLSGVVDASIVTVVLPCRNEPGAGVSVVLAAASASENCAVFSDWAPLVSVPAGEFDGARLQSANAATTIVPTAAPQAVARRRPSPPPRLIEIAPSPARARPRMCGKATLIHWLVEVLSQGSAAEFTDTTPVRFRVRSRFMDRPRPNSGT